jgi:hypothetical protein
MGPFDARVIKAWVIVYDQDAEKSYTFTSHAKAVASVESSIRGYLCESEMCDPLCDIIRKKLRSMREAMIIPIKVDDLHITVYKWEFDKQDGLHQLLTDCYDATDDNKVKLRIAKMFSIGVAT